MLISREQLLRALETVEPGRTARDKVDQSSCFAFQDGRVITFDGEEISCNTDSGLDDSFHGAVQGKKFLELLQKLPDDKLDVTQKGKKLLVRGRGKLTEITMDQEVMLPLDALEHPEDWKPLPESFLSALELVKSCAADPNSNDQNFDLTCIHLTPKWIEAGSQLQLARYSLKLPLESSVLVRRDSIKPVVALGVTELAETDNWVHLRNPSGTVLSCRRYLDQYRDTGKLIHTRGGEPVTFPKGLAEAAGRAAIFSSEEGDTNYVLVSLAPGKKLKITGTGITGRHTELAPAKYKGPPVKFLINPELLADIAKRNNECFVSMTGDVKMLRIQGEDWVYLASLVDPEAVRTLVGSTEVEE